MSTKLAPLAGIAAIAAGIDTAAPLRGRSDDIVAQACRLITSAAGLAVAIPTFILYSYLATYARTLMHDMERGGIEVVNIIEDARRNTEILSFAERKAGASEPQAGERDAGAASS